MCKKVGPYSAEKTCVAQDVPPPTPAPVPGVPTTASPTCACESIDRIPDECEVDVLIDMMETFVLAAPNLLGQWLRAGFHDAGTFDQGGVSEGGANGCLMNHPPMR